MRPGAHSLLKRFASSLPGRLAAWALLAACLFSLAQVALIAWAGGEWTRWFHARNPLSRLLFASLCALSWHALRRGVGYAPGEWAEFGGKIALALFGVGAGLAAGEVLLRVYLQRTQSRQSIARLDAGAADAGQRRIRSTHPMAVIVRRSANPKLVYELKPNLDMEFGHRTLRTNSMGLRESRDYPVERQPRSVRIIGLGDSGIFGWGVNQDEDYLSVLESNLNRRADGVLYEALNFGVPGYNTQLEVESLRCRGLAFKPDIVIVGWCDNDFGLPFFIPQEGQWRRKDVSFLYALLFDREKFADIALCDVRDQRDYDQSRVPEDIRGGVDVAGVKQALTDLTRMGREQGFHVLVFGSMRREAVDICRELRIPYFNIRERIPADRYPKEYNIYFMHPRAEGHRVLARHLEEELDRLGWLTPREAAP